MPGEDANGGAPPASWRRRLAWMLVLWAAGVAALGAVALALRGAMALFGLAR